MTRTPWLVAGALALATTVALTGCAAAASQGDLAEEQYCLDSGGTLQLRQPTFGTNDDPSTWVALGDPVQVCRFQTLGDSDDSRIYVDLVTLASRKPTLAALAYLAKTPLPDTEGGANPATALCAALGGATEYGSSASGGGLVSADDPIDTVIVPCMFADGSFIEEWGIAYYSDGTVRGADLAPLFRFDSSSAPAIFG